jgi:S1-C subfamily serine protease
MTRKSGFALVWLIVTVLFRPANALQGDESDAVAYSPESTGAPSALAHTTDPLERARQSTVMVLTTFPGTDRKMSGTGALLNKTGLILTNNHVVDPNHGRAALEKRKITRTGAVPKHEVILGLAGGQREVFPATLIYHVESVDLGLLQLDDVDGKPPRTPNYLPILPDGLLQVDTKIRVMGFPGGKEEFVSSEGLIRKLIKTKSGAISYLNTDAVAASGHSGGPFVDSSGRLVGVVALVELVEGRTNRSGGIPAHLVKQFLLNAFQQERTPADSDLLPFADMFVDENGGIDLPGKRRDKKTAVHWRDGTVRKGTLIAKELTVESDLGRLDVPLSWAAYLVIDGETGTFLMDGGDRISFPTANSSLTVAIDGVSKEIRLTDAELFALPMRSKAVPPRKGRGILLTADGCRLGLSRISGKFAVGRARFDPLNVSTIEATSSGDHLLETVDGQRVTGDVEAGAPITAAASWSDGPIRLNFASIRHAAFRAVEWSAMSARGRKLIERLAFLDEDLKPVAHILDGPDWSAARAAIVAARKRRGRSTEGRRHLQLLEAVEALRAADFKEATASFTRLKSRGDVGWVAKTYLAVLDRFPNGSFRGRRLSEPDVMWAASTKIAKEILKETDDQFARWLTDTDHNKTRELRAIEDQLDVADRLEIGCAQSRQIQTLSAAFFATYRKFMDQFAERRKLVSKHNNAHPRIRYKFRGKIKKMEKQIELTVDEGRRIHRRLTTETIGYVIEWPQVKGK